MYYAKNLREYRVSETAQHAAGAAEKFGAACTSEELSYKVKCETGNPLDLMASYARYHDLTIVGARHLFDYGVIDEPKNLLCRLVKEGVQPIIACAEEFRPIKRTLIAYNGSIESAAAMKKFVQLNLWLEVQTRIVYFAKETASSRQLLEEAAEYCKLYGFNPETSLIDEDPKEGILSQAAQWDADIIVMGNSDLSPLVSQIFEDTTLHAIKHADRALFLAQ